MLYWLLVVCCSVCSVSSFVGCWVCDFGGCGVVLYCLACFGFVIFCLGIDFCMVFCLLIVACLLVVWCFFLCLGDFSCYELVLIVV